MARKKKEKPVREYTRRQLSQVQKHRRRQRLVLIGGSGIIAAVVIIVLVGWILSEYLPMHRPVLRVNDTEINMRYYIDALKFSKLTSRDETVTLAVLASGLMSQIQQTELVRQEAIKLGIQVDDEDAIAVLQSLGVPRSRGYIEVVKRQLYARKMQDEYFRQKVPATDLQVHAMIMYLESEEKAREIRERLLSGENFTALAPEFGQDYYSKNINKGDYGWHPRGIYELQLSSTIPIDFAFSAEVGTLSEPLSDNETYKQLGYWLIRVNDITPASGNESASANVSAVLASSEVIARQLKARLEAGEGLKEIAEQYSGYSPSRDNGGELGRVPESGSGNVTAAFNGYVFGQSMVPGKWSDPIRETELWTRGGAWLVKVLGRDEDRPVSEEDRDQLVEKMLSDWMMQVQSDPAAVVDNSFFNDDLQRWAIDRAGEELGI